MTPNEQWLKHCEISGKLGFVKGVLGGLEFIEMPENTKRSVRDALDKCHEIGGLLDELADEIGSGDQLAAEGGR